MGNVLGEAVAGGRERLSSKGGLGDMPDEEDASRGQCSWREGEMGNVSGEVDAAGLPAWRGRRVGLPLLEQAGMIERLEGVGGGRVWQATADGYLACGLDSAALRRAIWDESQRRARRDRPIVARVGRGQRGFGGEWRGACSWYPRGVLVQ